MNDLLHAKDEKFAIVEVGRRGAKLCTRVIPNVPIFALVHVSKFLLKKRNSDRHVTIEQSDCFRVTNVCLVAVVRRVAV
jgi:hypothetical protein